MPLEQPKPASFVRSTWEGIKGFFKGGIAGAVIGTLIVGGIAAVVGAIAPSASFALVKAMFPEVAKNMAATAMKTAFSSSGGLGLNWLANAAANAAPMSHAAAAGWGALSGGILGAGVFASLGSLAGAITGTVKSREPAQLSSGALVNALNMAHQHGELVGQQQVVQQLVAAQQHEQQKQAHDTKWRDKIVKEQAATAVAQANATVH